MNNDDREKAKEIFVQAIKLAPDLRLSYLGEVCGDDAALRIRIAARFVRSDGIFGDAGGGRRGRGCDSPD